MDFDKYYENYYLLNKKAIDKTVDILDVVFDGLNNNLFEKKYNTFQLTHVEALHILLHSISFTLFVASATVLQSLNNSEEFEMYFSECFGPKFLKLKGYNDEISSDDIYNITESYIDLVGTKIKSQHKWKGHTKPYLDLYKKTHCEKHPPNQLICISCIIENPLFPSIAA